MCDIFHESLEDEHMLMQYVLHNMSVKQVTIDNLPHMHCCVWFRVQLASYIDHNQLKLIIVSNVYKTEQDRTTK